MKSSKLSITRVLAPALAILVIVLVLNPMGQASAASVPFPQPIYYPCPVTGPSHLLVFFDLNNEAGLTNYLTAAYYNPASPAYHNFISAGQFDAQYSAPAWVFSTVQSIFWVTGVAVISTAPMLIEGSGSSTQVGNALNQLAANAGIQRFIIGAECMPETFETAPSASTAHTLTPSLARGSYVGKSPLSAEANGQSSNSCTPTLPDSIGVIWTPCGLQTIYDENSLLGHGYYGQQPQQTIALVDAFGDPNLTEANNLVYVNDACSDFAIFNAQFDLPNAPCSIIYPTGLPQLSVNNYQDAEGWGSETAIDTQYSHVMDPQAHILEVTSSTDYDDLYASVEYVVNHQLASEISLSWGEWEDAFYCSNPAYGCSPPVQAALILGYDEVFQQAAAQGIGVFVSSADYGAYDPIFAAYVPPYGEISTESPGSDPWVSTVGGTTLTATFTSTSVTRTETAWSLGSDSYAPEIASGGGYSMVFGQTEGQQLIHAATQVSSIPEPILGITFYPQGQRGVPDLAADGDPSTGVLIIQSGSFSPYVWGGTSVATPLTAGMSALIQSHHADFTIGILAPTLYQLYAQEGAAFFYVHQSTFNNYQLEYGVLGTMFETSSGQNGPYTVTPGVWNPVAGLGQLNAYGLSQVIPGAGYP